MSNKILMKFKWILLVKHVTIKLLNCSKNIRRIYMAVSILNLLSEFDLFLMDKQNKYIIYIT